MPHRLRVFLVQRGRRAYIFANAWELSIAVAALASAAQFALSPAARQAIAVGELGAALGWWWTALYALGGLGMTAGIVKPSDRLELAGLSCFAAAAVVNAAALLQARGPNGVYIALIYLAFTVAAVMRVRLLLTYRRITMKPPPGGGGGEDG